MSTASCASCIFWVACEWAPEQGQCRRNAPALEGWPETEAEDWCGEWSDGEETEEIHFTPEPE